MAAQGLGVHTSIPKKTQYTVKPVLSSHSKRRPKLVFKTEYCLMQVKSIALLEHSAILSNFIKLPFSLRPSFCLFLSGRLRQVLLFNYKRYLLKMAFPLQTNDGPTLNAGWLAL